MKLKFSEGSDVELKEDFSPFKQYDSRDQNRCSSFQGERDSSL